jgi:Fic family protein
VTNWSKDKPFNQLPDLPPKGFVVDAELSAALVSARVALARADQASSLMLNPEVLLSAIAVAEAQASSVIENIVTTRDALFESIASGNRAIEYATGMALEYMAAIEIGTQSVLQRPIGYPLIARLTSKILGHKTELRTDLGTFIGGPSTNVVYTPPVGQELIARKLDSLLGFMAENDFDPLIAISLAHYQFEAIHPFPDGNGRVGRLLIVLWLVQFGLLQRPFIAPSMAINADRAEYYKVLDEATSKAAYKKLVLFMLRVFEVTANNSVRQIKELIQAQAQLSNLESKVFPAGVGTDLSTLLFAKPYARISHLVDELGLSRPTAAKYLEELEALGFLQSVIRGRDKYFVNKTMIGILSWKEGK